MEIEGEKDSETMFFKYVVSESVFGTFALHNFQMGHEFEFIPVKVSSYDITSLFQRHISLNLHLICSPSSFTFKFILNM